MRSCPVCEASNDDDARYCELCGQRFPDDAAADALPEAAAPEAVAPEIATQAQESSPAAPATPAAWPAVLLGLFSLLLPGLGIPLGIAAMLLGQSRFLNGRRAGGLVAVLLGLLGFLSSVAIIVVLVLGELG